MNASTVNVSGVAFLRYASTLIVTTVSVSRKNTSILNVLSTDLLMNESTVNVFVLSFSTMNASTDIV